MLAIEFSLCYTIFLDFILVLPSGRAKDQKEIRKESEGYFYFIKVDAVPEMAVELEKEMRLRNETVLRYLILREGE